MEVHLMHVRSLAVRSSYASLSSGLAVREVLAPGLFIAAILGTNYALSALPNVKLFDLLVFVAGYTLGVRRGATVAVAAWLVYGQANPWGYAEPTLLATLMGAEVGYAIAGAVVRRLVPASSVRLRPSAGWMAFAGAAAVSTVAYDVATNAYTGLLWAALAGADDHAAWVWVALFNPGALFFAAAHLTSNIVFFLAFGPPLVRAADIARGRYRW
jgi:hypothetical protein